MASIFLSDSPEVVRIIVKKCNGLMQPEYKKLCVDPQITSFEILQCLLARAFDIKGDFTISYQATDDTGQKVYLSLLSDWDLDAAFFGASDPQLNLKVDLKPFEEGLDDWDILTPVDTKTNHRPTTLLGPYTLIGTLTKTVSNVTKAIGLRQDDVHVAREGRLPTPTKTLMSDAEFHTFMDTVGHLIQPHQFRLAVYQGGVEPSLRRVAWRHLLNIFPADMNGRERFDYLRHKSNEYFRLRDEWHGRETDEIKYVANMVKKDVLRTDRLYPFFAGRDDSQNGVSLFNILVTYAVTHPSTSYCQGMSDLASPILVVEKDEASAYICFCGLMRRLRSNFSEDGVAMTTKFRHMALLVQHYDPVFHAYMREHSADDMFFCYRWLLLEMKREFPLDDAMFMLEVMWSSLPLDPPDIELKLFDDGYSDFEVAESPTATAMHHTAAYVHLRSAQRRLSASQSQPQISGPDRAVASGTYDMRKASTPGEDINPAEFFEVDIEVVEEMKQKSSAIDKSFEGVDISKAVLRFDASTIEPVEAVDTNIQRLNTDSQQSGGFQKKSNSQGSKKDDNGTNSRERVNSISEVGEQFGEVEAELEVRKLGTDTSSHQTAVGNGSKICGRRISHRNSDSLGGGEGMNETSVWNHDEPLDSDSDENEDRPLINDESGDVADKSNPSESSASDKQKNPSSASLSSLTSRGVGVPQGMTKTSTAMSDEAVLSLEYPSIDFVKVTVEEKLVQLPPPAEFGSGNPFLMFLCLSLLLQHRDHIMANNMDYNDMAMYYDKMVRCHHVQQVVQHARSLYALYLRQQQQSATAADNDTDDTDSDPSV